ncbi:ABC transporter ATP-binding protein [Alteribacillus bidgolensis]|uniref:ABC transporter n=1 Tax=Alteribacillus bidgolensis TaxID=930129 RepID=A0A1G8EN49_9BACI|nr:dipeptide/oligopeptide/nickel ABC transporter ATP-binding protein [Alteribacillus bidgolensis]SDH71275.1 ABC transporter [Alteribacillus bidgolensis]
MSLLELVQVTKEFPFRPRKHLWWKKAGRFQAVKQVSLQLNQGECLGVVGESGSGKSTLAKLIMNLVPVTKGDILLNGCSIRQMKDLEVFKRMQLVLQDSHSALHPKMSVREIIQEPLLNFFPGENIKREATCLQLMEMAGIDKNLLDRRPYQLSGGQKQRVCIARALAVKPDVIIFDESIASIDQEAQQSILNRLKYIQAQENVAYLFITHDIETLKEFCQRVAVMYEGEIIDIFEEWKISQLTHPYSRLLLETSEETEIKIAQES